MQEKDNTTLITQSDLDRSAQVFQTATVDQAAQMLVAVISNDENALSQLPTQVQKNLSTTSSGDKRGLILSVDNIKDIKEYVNYGLGLTCDSSAISASMDYPKDFDAKRYPNLTPEKLANLHTMIQNHCKTWSDLEKRIKDQGVVLESYAQHFVSTASMVLEVINAMPLMAQIRTKLDNLAPLSEGASPLTQDDMDCLTEIVSQLTTLQADADTHYSNTSSLAQALETFRKYLDNDVREQLAAMEVDIHTMESSDKRSQLLTEKSNLDKEIKALKAQYDKLVGYSFTGAAGMAIPPLGIISWAVTGGIFGDKAEKVRKERNRLLVKQRDVIEQLTREDALTALVSRASGHITNCNTVLSDALTGVKNLESLWSCILQFVSDAMNQVKAITSEASLYSFKGSMSSASDSWSHVKDLTSSIIATFQEAEAQMKAN